MSLIKAIISILSIIMIRSYLITHAHGLLSHAQVIDQTAFKHEIFSIKFDEDHATFKGYAFVIEQQHHRDHTTHEISLEFVNSRGESDYFIATLHPANYTTHMQYRSTLMCPHHLFEQMNTVYYPCPVL